MTFTLNKVTTILVVALFALIIWKPIIFSYLLSIFLGGK